MGPVCALRTNYHEIFEGVMKKTLVHIPAAVYFFYLPMKTFKSAESRLCKPKTLCSV